MTGLSVIFDLDGTLLDSESLAFRAWMRAITDLEYSFSKEQFVKMLAMSKRDLAFFLADEYGGSFPFTECWESYTCERERILDEEGVQVKPGTPELVAFLQERKISYCVATSSTTIIARQRLQKAGIDGLFPALLGGESVVHGKPHPDIFLKAAQLLEAQPEDCVVIEDSAPGVRAAASAGMRVILVPDLQEPQDELRRLASCVCSDLCAARDFLDALLCGKE